MATRDTAKLVRFSTEEKTWLTKEARKIGCSLEAYIRSCCLDDRRIVMVDRKQVQKIIKGIHDVQRSMTQIVNLARNMAAVDQSTVEKAVSYQDLIYQLLSQINQIMIIEKTRK